MGILFKIKQKKISHKDCHWVCVSDMCEGKCTCECLSKDSGWAVWAILAEELRGQLPGIRVQGLQYLLGRGLLLPPPAFPTLGASAGETEKDAAWSRSQECRTERWLAKCWLWRPWREQSGRRPRLRLTGGNSQNAPPSSYLGSSPWSVSAGRATWWNLGTGEGSDRHTQQWIWGTTQKFQKNFWQRAEGLDSVAQERTLVLPTSGAGEACLPPPAEWLQQPQKRGTSSGLEIYTPVAGSGGWGTLTMTWLGPGWMPCPVVRHTERLEC